MTALGDLLGRPPDVTWRRGEFRRLDATRREFVVADGYVGGPFGLYRREGDSTWRGVHLRTGWGCAIHERTLSRAKERARRILARTGLAAWDDDFGIVGKGQPDDDGKKRLRALASDVGHPDAHVPQDWEG